jgi:hypothetical protein
MRFRVRSPLLVASIIVSNPSSSLFQKRRIGRFL